MIKCLTGTRFSMNAEVLRWTGIVEGTSVDSTEGEWSSYQDPITLEIRNTWAPAVPDDPNTPANEFVPETIACLARGVQSQGVSLTGSSERFGEWYQNIEYVRMWVPANVQLTKRDRVTNIREAKTGKIVWMDEEYDGTPRPTIFNVSGVTPIFDPFNKHVENIVYLERADI